MGTKCDHGRELAACSDPACGNIAANRRAFDRNVRAAVHTCRMVHRWLDSTRRYHTNYLLAIDDLKWAWFYGGRVSEAACQRSATTRMLRRSDIVQRACRDASTALQNAVSTLVP